MNVFQPKLFTTLKNYSKEQFINDAIAGFIVAIIALPLSIALAIASGVSPEKGLHTAIIAGFLISFLGGSRVQIGGPTGAFMVIIYGIILEYGFDGMIVATFMAGIMIMLMGLFKFGSMIKYIPYPVTSGFTTGIAIIILMSQVKDFLGLSIAEKIPSDFISKASVYFKYIETINYQALIIGVVSLLILFFWPKFNKKVPGALIVLIVMSIVTKVLGLNIATIGSTFSDLSASIPVPRLPHLNLEIVQKMFMPALAIALLESIESLLSAVVADGMIGAKHRSNTELIAQGIANIVSSIFGGIPATGAIARTVANINNGGRTPVAGMLHAVYLFIIMMLFLPLAKMIPLAALAAILIMVAINMGEWSELKTILSAPKSDAIILFSVCIITVLLDLVVAIEVGMVLAAFLFMKRMADMTHVKVSSFDASEAVLDIPTDELTAEYGKNGIYVYEINGPFFFGAADKFIDTLHHLDAKTKGLIVRMHYVNSIDATAVHALKRMIKVCNEYHIKLMMCELNKQPYDTLLKMDIISSIGEDNIFEKFEDIVNV